MRGRTNTDPEPQREQTGPGTLVRGLLWGFAESRTAHALAKKLPLRAFARFGLAAGFISAVATAAQLPELTLDDNASAELVDSNLVDQAPRTPGNAIPLDAQRCNAECQERYSNCLQECDGNPACKKACGGTVAACVEECSRIEAPLPSGSTEARRRLPRTGVAPSSSATPSSGVSSSASAAGTAPPAKPSASASAKPSAAPKPPSPSASSGPAK